MIDLPPLEKRLQKFARESRLGDHIVQLDYLQSWLLNYIAASPAIGSGLVFKGGTALKKCYFGRYRFSEDLDFTALAGAISGQHLLQEMTGIVSAAEEAMNEYAPIRLTCERYLERDPHPASQEAFKVRAQFPSQREPLISAMIEISFNERLAYSPVRRPIFHEYGEPLNQIIQVYSLQEIIIEKLRGILQHTKKLHEHGWTRSRTRDYYDLYRLLQYDPVLFLDPSLAAFLKMKCRDKNVHFQTTDDFFDARFLEEVHRDWEKHLGYLLTDLPPLQEVLEKLRAAIEQLLMGKAMSFENQ